jgi:oligoribonuclease NrnB/cAMP/cGMP phosphodiesterase (DHH superfamily)
MDNDTKMIKEMGEALIDLQVKYRSSSLSDRMALKPALEELLADYAELQKRLIKEGVITTDEDLEEMTKIKEEIDRAAKQEGLLKVIARTIAFIAIKV